MRENSYFGQHIPFKVEEFKLDYLGEGIGYIKRYDDGKFKLKCVDNDYFPMILRLIQSGYVMLNDLFFVHKGALARFNDVPKIFGKCSTMIKVQLWNGNGGKWNDKRRDERIPNVNGII